MIHKFIRYSFIGILNSAIWFAVLWTLASLHFHYIAYTSIAYLAAMTASFFLNLFFTFPVRDHVLRRALFFFALNLFNLILTQMVQYALIEYCHLMHPAAIFTGMIFYTLTGFLLNNFIVYSHILERKLPQKENGVLPTRQIYLCADDYGQNEAISTGILTLIEQKKINAASCMVTEPGWEAYGMRLKPFASNTFIGLHLNLTHQAHTHHKQHRPLPGLIIKAFLRCLSHKTLMTTIMAQINAFIDVMGFFPDFIDGHEHVHQLPVIRDALITVICRARTAHIAPPASFFIRQTVPYTTAIPFRKTALKALIISHLGGYRLRKLLKRHHILCNTSFGGVYDFQNAAHYRQYFQSFLHAAEDGGLIMCHPGMPANTPDDPIALSRALEMAYFSSSDYETDIQWFKLQYRQKNVK